MSKAGPYRGKEDAYMKLKNYTFLANANRKRGKRSTALFLLLLFSVIALVLIMSVTSMLQRAMDGFTDADPARRVEINSYFPEPGKGVVLTEEVLDDIRKLDHVQSVDINDGMVRQIFNITALADENGKDCSGMMPPTNEYGYSFEAWSLYKTQRMEVVAGKTLDESPVFSCLVPSSFCPVSDYTVDENIYPLQNGADYIGKIFTVKSLGDYYAYWTYYKDNEGGYMTNAQDLPALEYKLKVVGTFYAAYNGDGMSNQIYVSNETGQKIEEMAVKATNDQEFIEQYKKDKTNPAMHSYTVLADSYENFNAVRQEIDEMGVFMSAIPEQFIPPSLELFANVFTSAGNFFTIAVLILTVINLFLATSSGLLERKGEIGLLKAIGYKNRQIFLTLYLEQLRTGLIAFAIGGSLSAVCVVIMNLVNANGPFAGRIYVVSWVDFALLAAAALLLTTAIPLLCELVMVKSLTKISPREAMAPQ